MPSKHIRDKIQRSRFNSEYFQSERMCRPICTLSAGGYYNGVNGALLCNTNCFELQKVHNYISYHFSQCIRNFKLYAKTKLQELYDQSLCFRYKDSAIPHLLKTEMSRPQSASVTVQASLCRTWSETKIVGFLTQWFILLLGFIAHLSLNIGYFIQLKRTEKCMDH